MFKIEDATDSRPHGIVLEVSLTLAGIARCARVLRRLGDYEAVALADELEAHGERIADNRRRAALCRAEEIANGERGAA